KEKKTGANKTTLLALPTRKVVFRRRDAATEDDDKMEKFMENIAVEDVPRRAGPTFKWEV
ncbi:hypothetical protein FRC00_007423, partial [Tulasnella sp. 408]